MKNQIQSLFILTALCICFILCPLLHYAAENPSFIPNKGQWKGAFTFKADFSNLSIFTLDDGFRYSLSDQIADETDENGEAIYPDVINKHAFSLHFINANPLSFDGIAKKKAYHNYFLGNESSKWQSKVPLFEALSSENIYEGIDLKVYSEENNFKYDFIVQPGYDASKIAFNYTGHDGVLFSHDKLTIQTSIGEIIESIPVSYQIINGARIQVACRYSKLKRGYGFAFPEGYDEEFPLVIDPILVAATLAGTPAGDVGPIQGSGATYDQLGNIYLFGGVGNTNFPITEGAYQVGLAGGGYDAVFGKFNPDGSDLIYATFMGGNLQENVFSAVISIDGNAYLLGRTLSTNFPTSEDAVQTSIEGGWDIFVFALSADGGSMIGSTYLGGDGDDGNSGAEIFYNINADRGSIQLNCSESGDEIIIGSCSSSSNYPTTSGVFQENKLNNQDGVITKLSSTLNEIIWSSYIGSTGYDMVNDFKVRDDGSILVCGSVTNDEGFIITEDAYQSEVLDVSNLPIFESSDGFVSHISADGSSIIASTFIGKDDFDDKNYFIDFDSENNVYVCMHTAGYNEWVQTDGVWGTSPGRVMVHKLSEDLSELELSSFISINENFYSGGPTAFMVDACGKIYVTTYTGYSPWNDGLVATSDALFSEGTFYSAVFSPDMTDLEYGTFYIAGNFSRNNRYSKDGVLYHGASAGYGQSMATNQNAYSTTLMANNDIGVFKIDFENNPINAFVCQTTNGFSGCAPYEAQFANYTINEGGTTFEWDFGDGTTSQEYDPQHTYYEPGEYLVTYIVYNPESCNLRDTAYIPVTVFEGELLPDFSYNIDCDSGEIWITNNSSGPFDVEYSWDMGDGEILTTSDSLFAYAYAEDGVYNVTLTLSSNGCNDSETLEQEISFVPNIEADFNYDIIDICSGFEVAFQNESIGGSDYTWSMGDGMVLDEGESFVYAYDDYGVYTVQLIIEDEQSCNFSDTVSYTFGLESPPILNPEISIFQNGLCSDLSCTASVNPNGPFNDVTWTGDNGATGDELTFETSVNESGTYLFTVTVTDPICEVPYSSQVELEFVESLGIDIPPSLSLCFDDESVEIDSTVIYDDATYDWNNGLSNEPILEVTGEGEYQVEVLYNGCSDFEETDVNFIQQFSLSFEEVICEGQENTIAFSDPFGIVEEVIWDNGQMGTNLTVSQSGYYPFTAVDMWGCNQVDSLLVIPKDEDPNLEIPNVFTPNGDGFNDVFKIQGDDLVYFELQIFNRWGTLVYESNEVYGTWDGELSATSGEEANEDTFMYVLRYQDFCDQAPKSKTGYVKVLR